MAVVGAAVVVRKEHLIAAVLEIRGEFVSGGGEKGACKFAIFVALGLAGEAAGFDDATSGLEVHRPGFELVVGDAVLEEPVSTGFGGSRPVVRRDDAVGVVGVAELGAVAAQTEGVGDDAGIGLPRINPQPGGTNGR